MSEQNNHITLQNTEILRTLRDDLELIRKAVLQNASPEQQAEMFRRERVRLVTAGLTPIPVQGAKAFLHLIPVAPQQTNVKIDDAAVRTEFRQMSLLHGYPGYNRVNFDGLLNYDASERSNKSIASYTQLFRNGTIEYCDNNHLQPSMRDNKEQRVIYGQRFENHVVESVKSSLRFFERSGIASGVMVLVSLTGVMRYIVHTGSMFLDEISPIDRDEILFDGCVVEQSEQNLFQVLKPTFDLLWNASGFPKSPFYDENGERIK